MTKAVRYILFLTCAIQLLFAILFFRQTELWPFPGTTPLTFILLSSFFAAAAASTLWATASENYGALAGIGLDYFAILAPVSVLSLQLAASSNNPPLTTYGMASAFGALFGIGLMIWSLRMPLDHTLPMPSLVRWSFVLFVAVLLVVSIGLISNVPNIIPWKITPELSVLIGFMFLGAAAYFAYGLLRPGWVNAAGQLAGFLAYDLVLIVPFLVRLPTTAPEHRMGMIIYTVVLTYSGLLAIYYLFIHRQTRVWARSR